MKSRGNRRIAISPVSSDHYKQRAYDASMTPQMSPTPPVHMRPKLGPSNLQLDLPKMIEPYVPNRYNAGTTKEHINKLKLNYEKAKQKPKMLQSFDME